MSGTQGTVTRCLPACTSLGSRTRSGPAFQFRRFTVGGRCHPSSICTGQLVRQTPAPSSSLLACMCSTLLHFCKLSHSLLNEIILCIFLQLFFFPQPTSVCIATGRSGLLCVRAVGKPRVQLFHAFSRWRIYVWPIPIPWLPGGATSIRAVIDILICASWCTGTTVYLGNETCIGNTGSSDFLLARTRLFSQVALSIELLPVGAGV